jgi:hypothetical protein
MIILTLFSWSSGSRRISFYKALHHAPLYAEGEGIMSLPNTGVYSPINIASQKTFMTGIVCTNFLHVLTMAVVWSFPNYDSNYLYGL